MPPADERPYPVARPVPRLGRFQRAGLLVMAAGLVAVFATAAWLRPYTPAGDRRTTATHTQLGLPPCSVLVMTGKPCPSCGMTTSFSLLVHGDPVGSAKANWVGTLLALFWLALVPWGVLSAVRGRLAGVRNGELFATTAVGTFLTLALARWAWIFFLG